MSALNTHALGPDDQDGRINGTEDISVDSFAIAQVLGRAHRRAEAENAPNEARTILHVAHSFADALAETDPRFDRVQFIQATTESVTSAAAS